MKQLQRIVGSSAGIASVTASKAMAIDTDAPAFAPTLAPIAGGGLIWLAVVGVAASYVLLLRRGRRN